jgi:Tol biopolymer transport system component
MMSRKVLSGEALILLTLALSGILEPVQAITDTADIAFTSNRSGNYDIWVMDENGGSLRQLTTHPASDYLPRWSPDGSRIAFVSERDGRYAIYVMNADGSNQTRVVFSSYPNLAHGLIYGIAWSPDGQQLYYGEWLTFSYGVIKRVNLDGTDATIVLDMGERLTGLTSRPMDSGSSSAGKSARGLPPSRFTKPP